MKTYEFLNEDEQDTLMAIDDSIKHWKRLASGTAKPGEGIGGKDCELCLKFWFQSKKQKCCECPIANFTGHTMCDGSPYRDCRNDYYDHGKTSKQFRASAKKMLEFLTEVRSDFLATAKKKK
jgi:hypothetical protein